MNTSSTELPNGTVTSPRGFRAGAVYSGLKTPQPGQLDLGLLYSESPAAVAGVFTTNRFRAAPVQWCQEHVAKGHARAIIVNAGNANAGTGAQGVEAAAQMAALAAKKLGLTADEVLVASTGVIGVPLPMDKIAAGVQSLDLNADGGADFSRAIMTTDTKAKTVAVELSLPGGKATIGGAAKGVGMIHPNMATMLSFVTTDLAVDPAFLAVATKAAADKSFNMVTVDGDTSTNDTLLVLANGAAGNTPISESSPEAAAFQSALDDVCIYLAKCIARDGEGATKIIEVQVAGAQATDDARAIARSIAGSSLVKSAAYGNDPNWGRLLMAAGKAGVPLDTDKVDVFIGPVCVMRNGQPLPFDRAHASSIINNPEVVYRLDLHLGSGEATGWGCDLTEEYVHINAHYTT